MLRFYITILSLLLVGVSCKENSFQNVTIKVYSLFVEKLTKTVEDSNDLNKVLPENFVYDRIDLVGQHVPILYEGAFKNLDNLDELIIDDSNLQEIKPFAFKNSENLRKIVIQNNPLKKINKDVFSNLKTFSLNLPNNSIEFIDPEAFNNMANLLNIDLYNNKLTTWDSNWFLNCPSIRRISFQHNLLTSLPENAFKNLGGTKSFDLNLIFSYNQIKSVNPKALSGLRKIRDLWLDNNQLTTFEEDIIKEVTIKDLRLNHNNIQCLKGNLNNIFKAKSSHLDFNPMQCSCVEKVEEWQKTTTEHTVDIYFLSANCDLERMTKKMRKIESLLKKQ